MAWPTIVSVAAGLFHVVPAAGSCVDKSANCPYLVSINECDLDPEYMRNACPASCSFCLTTTTTSEVAAYKWFLTAWSTCSRTCGWGTRVRNVYCVHWCSYFSSGLCPRKGDSQCLKFEERPENSEDCYGTCPITSTATTSSLTMTVSTFSTQTSTTATVTEIAFRDYDCVPLAEPQNCLAKDVARSLCGPSCFCCVKTSKGVPIQISSASWRPLPSTESASDSSSPDMVLIVCASVSGGITLMLSLVWWMSCINRAEKAKALRPYKAPVLPPPSPTGSKGKTRSFWKTFTFKKKKKRKDTGVIFDRKLGKGVASAPPDGYFEEEVFADVDGAFTRNTFEPDDGGRHSPSAAKKTKQYVVIDGEYFTAPADQNVLSPSSPSRGRSRPGNLESPASSPSASKLRGVQPESAPSSPNASKRCASRPGTNSPVASKSRSFLSESTRSSPSNRPAPHFAARHPQHQHDGLEESDYSVSDDTDSSYSSADTPTSSIPKSPNGGKLRSPSENLPPGFASASRASRRSGKEPPHPWEFHGTQQPPPMPGQANFENTDIPKGKPNRRGMATPPRANESGSDDPNLKQNHGQTSSGDRDAHNGPRRSNTTGATGQAFPGDRAADSGPKRSHTFGATGNASSSDRKADSGPGQNSASGTTGASSSGENYDPRTARDAGTSSAAFDLITKVDCELDQTSGKDLETRRKVFKNLMLRWHPDKNQTETMAAEIFRHLMSRRDRYLEA
eukprot:TRINITY_DN41455_c0_g1_i1.p1 TRINITY_DN41455_c0_g1~~TRINITY_DN41455_c0_g1_i1.p1  ORF type:complete len:741 (-),score=72.86 TRINITY_DN41455_c0_g1_i1:240-2441(-)